SAFDVDRPARLAPFELARASRGRDAAPAGSRVPVGRRVPRPPRALPVARDQEGGPRLARRRRGFGRREGDARPADGEPEPPVQALRLRREQGVRNARALARARNPWPLAAPPSYVYRRRPDATVGKRGRRVPL